MEQGAIDGFSFQVIEPAEDFLKKVYTYESFWSVGRESFTCFAVIVLL